MPPEGFDGIGQLFMKAGNGEYVPFTGLQDTKEISGQTDDKYSFTADDFRDAMLELQGRIEAACPYDTALMNGETLMALVANRAVTVEGKEFRYNGVNVMTSPYLPVGAVYLVTREVAEQIIADAEPKQAVAVSEYQIKKELKRYHCRVCGRPYCDAKEAKTCVRSHEWQNRKGRR